MRPRYLISIIGTARASRAQFTQGDNLMSTEEDKDLSRRMEEVSDIRLRLAEIIFKAENDEDFHKRLAAEPTAVLAKYGIPENAVEEFSKGISQARLGDGDPTVCIHT